MVYDNMSNITTSFAEFAQYGNYVAEGWLGRVIILTWFIISFTILSRNYSPKSAFIASSFTAMFFGILFRVMGIMSDADIFIAIAVFLISIGLGLRSDS